MDLSKPCLEPAAVLQDSFRRLKETIDPFGIADANWAVQRGWLEHPEAFSGAFARFAQSWWKVYLHSIQRLSGIPEADAIEAVEEDERFTDPMWTENPVLDVLKEQYLLYTRTLVDAYFAAPCVDDRVCRRSAFWLRQYLNAVAPTNFFWTNPVAVQKYLESGGQSLSRGLQNWAKDMLAGGDIRMVDESGFRVGQNLATTPGAVVFRNHLLEVIQYAPTTEQVRTVPLVLVSPWINKYYILDLTEENSMVRWLVSQGFTVFVTSWKNPTRDMRDTTFDDYVLQGVLEAVKVAQSVSGSRQVHLTGYCIGGTAVSCLMAWLNREAKPKNQLPVAHWTLFASLVDFSLPGDIDVFIDEDVIEVLDDMMEQDGYLDGKALQRSFRMLRPNSLIWRYFVHNYLYGETPPPIPVLYWNTDGTRLPQAMHSQYLRAFYLDNRLITKDALELGGRRLDLGRIGQPLYMVGTEEDHITPWRQTFHICRHLGGTVRYVLASSGHILGIVNPPAKAAKRKYWAGAAEGEADGPAWLGRQTVRDGSWWHDWAAWLHERCGDMKAPPALGNDQYPVLLPAPGSYVYEH